MTTRSKKKSEPPAHTSPILSKRVENSWLLLVKDSLLTNDNFSIITLQHPAHGKPTKFCLDAANNKIYEVVTFDESNRSWFIGETVKSNGSLQMLTPMNPLYLVIPRLKEQCGTRAIPLEDLLSEKGFDKLLDYINNLDMIADLKGSPEMKAYKYNEEKTFQWLEDRTRKLAKVLRQKNVHVTSGAVSATFVTSNISNDGIDEDFYLKYAHGMISEYLQEDFVQKLEQRLHFKPELIEAIGKKRKSDLTESNDHKKLKRENGDIECKGNEIMSESFTEVKKQKPLSAKEKARQKAASGTKTISAFFSKK